MVTNIAGIIVMPIDFYCFAFVCISGEPRVIHLRALSCPQAVPYVAILLICNLLLHNKFKLTCSYRWSASFNSTVVFKVIACF